MTLLLLLLAVVMIIVPPAMRANGYGAAPVWLPYLLWLVALLSLIGVLLHMFFMLTSLKLFNHHYRLTWRYLKHSDLAIRIADFAYYDELGIQLALRGYDIYPCLPRHKTLEQSLELKCGFVRALIAVAQGRPGDISRIGTDGWFAYLFSKRFEPGAAKYFRYLGESALGCVSLVPYQQVTSIGTGTAFIASRAVLVAFLDFMLEEPPPWVDELTPPETGKRPWWLRSVAPLLKG